MLSILTTELILYAASCRGGTEKTSLFFKLTPISGLQTAELTFLEQLLIHTVC
jgi:hypothetical protein